MIDNPTGGNIWRWVNPAGDEFIKQAGSSFDLPVWKDPVVVWLT